MSWSGYYLKNGLKCHLELVNFNCDPDYGIISGQTVDGGVVYGVIKKNRDLSLQLKTKKFGILYFWGSMCKDRESIYGNFIMVNGESQGTFRIEHRERIQRQNNIVTQPINADDREIKAALDKVNSIIAQGKPWTDPDFRPETNSLYNKGEVNYKEYKQYRDYKWQRASKIFKNNLNVFTDNISPNDILQGALGNCYFLCVLSAAAEVPERVKQRIKIQQINKAGIYLVTFFINGIETPVIIDDWFPIKYNQPAFCSSQNGSIWAMLLEKAWAKIHGSYQRTESNSPGFAAQHVFGYPTIRIKHDAQDFDPNIFFNKILNYDKRNYIMLSVSNLNSPNGDEVFDGVFTQHAYSLISAHEVMNGVKLLKLRNPWGNSEWTGAWSDKWTGWTPELKTELQEVDSDDGQFFIALEDYLTHFCSTYIGVWQEKEVSHCEARYSNERTAYFSFTLMQSIDLQKDSFAIEVCQLGDRIRNYKLQGPEQFETSRFSLILINKQGEVIGKMIENIYNSFLTTLLVERPVLDANEYTLVVDVIWNEIAQRNSAYRDVLIRAITTVPLTFTKIDAQLGENILAQSLKKIAQSQEKIIHRFFARKDDEGYGKNYYSVFFEVGYYLAFYRKNESKYTAREFMEYKITQGKLEVVGRYDTQLDILSGEDHIIILRQLVDWFEQTTQYKVDYTVDCKYTPSPIWSDQVSYQNCNQTTIKFYQIHQNQNQEFYRPKPLSDAELIAEAQKKDLSDIGQGVYVQRYFQGEGGVALYTNSGPQTMTVLLALQPDSKNYRIEGGCKFMRKTFEIPPNNGKYSLFFRTILQDAESLCNYSQKILTSDELIQSNEKWTKYVNDNWKKYCRERSGDLNTEEAAKLFKETLGCSSAEFESYFQMYDEDNNGTMSKQEIINYLVLHCIFI